MADRLADGDVQHGVAPEEVVQGDLYEQRCLAGAGAGRHQSGLAGLKPAVTLLVEGAKGIFGHHFAFEHL